LRYNSDGKQSELKQNLIVSTFLSVDKRKMNIYTAVNICKYLGKADSLQSDIVKSRAHE